LNRFNRTAEIREVVMTDATMSEALIQYKREHGHVAMRKLLQDVAGVNAISEVATADIAAVTEAAVAGCKTKPAPKAKASPKPNFADQNFVNGVYARWNGAAN
jgi:DNA-binding protein H-NS